MGSLSVAEPSAQKAKPIADAPDIALAPGPDLVPPQPWWMRVGRRLQPAVNRLVARGSLVGDRPVYDSGDFPWVAELERNWTAIRDEAAAVLQQLENVPPLAEISPDHRDIAPAKKW